MKNDEIIIAFTKQSGKFWSRLLCGNFKHCCVIFRYERFSNYILLQIATDGVRLISLDEPALGRMQQDGWTMIKSTTNHVRHFYPQSLTCVGFAKRAVGIKNPFVWTPDQLYKKINNMKK